MTTSPNDVAILRDVNGKPIPQIWDSDAGEFVAYEGENVIIDADGNKLAINADGSIDVSGVATETTIEAVKTAVEGILSSKVVDALGVNELSVNADGSIDVDGVATETTVDAIKDAVEATLSSKIIDSAGVNELSVNADGSIDVDGVATETTLDAVKTAVEGTVDTNVRSSRTESLISDTSTLSNYDSLSIQADVEGYVAKTAYVLAEQEGWAGIEVSLDAGTSWLPLISNQSQFFKDNFLGNDIPPPNWTVTREGDYVDNNTFAQLTSDQLQITGEADSTGTGRVFTFLSTSYLYPNTTIEFVINEADFMTNSDTGVYLNVSITENIPPDDTRPPTAETDHIMYFRGNGNISLIGGTIQTPTPVTDARYKLMILPDKVVLFRNGEFMDEHTITVSAQEMYFFYELALPANLSGNAYIDEFTVSNIDANAKVHAGETWVKTVTDAVPGLMRVSFENGTHSNPVKINLCGQA